jgi:hypothetical protein
MDQQLAFKEDTKAAQVHQDAKIAANEVRQSGF